MREMYHIDLELKSIAERNGVEKEWPKISRYAKPALAFSLEPPRGGRSRFGGSPLLPRGFHWPFYTPPQKEIPAQLHGLMEIFGMSEKTAPSRPRALNFLLQIDLAELRKFDAAQHLPSSGLLTFFYDIENQPWGFDPDNLNGFRVELIKDDYLVETPPPGEAPFPSRELNFWEVTTIPYSGSRTYAALAAEIELSHSYNGFRIEVERNNYPDERLRSLLAGGHHQLLGHAANLQGDMQLEAQLVSHGLYCGDSTGYEDSRASSLEAGADDWLLLLQLDSEASLEMKWGDVGMLYFWIRRSDLAACRFDRCWMTLQC